MFSDVNNVYLNVRSVFNRHAKNVDNVFGLGEVAETELE